MMLHSEPPGSSDDLESFDVNAVRVEASTLHSLEPIGIGTSQCEALTSYIARVARSHCISVNTLYTRVLGHAVQRNEIRTDGAYSRMKEVGHRINGVGTIAERNVAGMELLTRRHELRELTMLKWAEVLPAVDLMAKEKRWCPVCYEDSRVSGADPYDRLLWAVASVDMCPNHRVLLVSKCPHCEKAMHALGANGNPGFCDYCKGWLGAVLKPDISNVVCFARAELVGEMIAATPRFPTITRDPKRHSKVIFALMKARNCKMTAGGLAKYCGISRDVACDWLYRESRLILRVILFISDAFGVSALEFLTAPIETLAWQVPSPTMAIPQFKARGRGTALETIRVLNNELVNPTSAPVPFTALCKRLGVSAKTAYGHCPEVASELSRRFTEHAKKQRAAKFEAIYDEAIRVVQDLKKLAIPVTLANLIKRLSNGGVIRCPEVRSRLREIVARSGSAASQI